MQIKQDYCALVIRGPRHATGPYGLSGFVHVCNTFMMETINPINVVVAADRMDSDISAVTLVVTLEISNSNIIQNTKPKYEHNRLHNEGWKWNTRTYVQVTQ